MKRHLRRSISVGLENLQPCKLRATSHARQHTERRSRLWNFLQIAYTNSWPTQRTERKIWTNVLYDLSQLIPQTLESRYYLGLTAELLSCEKKEERRVPQAKRYDIKPRLISFLFSLHVFLEANPIPLPNSIGDPGNRRLYNDRTQNDMRQNGERHWDIPTQNVSAKIHYRLSHYFCV